MDGDRIVQLTPSSDWVAEYLDVGGVPLSYTYVIGFVLLEVVALDGELEQAIAPMEFSRGGARFCDTQEGFNRIVPRDSVCHFINRPRLRATEDPANQVLN